MDLETRGVISAIIKNVYENQHILKTIKWILETDDQVIVTEDLALGYIMGSLMKIANNVAENRKLSMEMDEYYKKSLKKIYGKEEGLKKYIEHKIEKEEIKEKKTQKIDFDLTQEEIEDIRDMLKPMIVRFREKIRQEEVLGTFDS